MKFGHEDVGVFGIEQPEGFTTLALDLSNFGLCILFLLGNWHDRITILEL